MNKLHMDIKVLYLIHTTSMCGSTISFIRMIQGLFEKGIQIYIVHPDKEINTDFYRITKDFVKEYCYIDLKSHTIDRNYQDQTFLKRTKQFIKRSRLFQKILFRKEREDLRNIAVRIQPDIIHTNVGPIHAGYMVASELNIPHVWHLREYQTKDFGWQILPSYHSFMDMVNDSYVITITQGIRNYFGLDKNPKARVIYDGCADGDDVLFNYPKKKYFLCCSRVSPEKGQETAIRAFSSVYKKYPDYELIIAGFGDPRYIHKLKKLAGTLDCAKAVKFIGFQEDIKKWISNAAALIVASRFEGFGMMTAEAAFYGCLVIGHNTGGTKEILDITGGLTYEEENELQSKMEDVLNLSGRKYEELILRAQEEAIKNFTIKNHVEQIFSFYNDILSERNRRC